MCTISGMTFRAPPCRFTRCILLFQFLSFLFSVLLSFQVSKFLFFLVSFSWNELLHAIHVITNGIFSVFLLNFLFSVFGQCKASRKGEICLSLSLLFRSCMYGSTCARIFIRSRALWSNLWYFSIKFLLLPWSFSSSDDVSISLLSTDSASFFPSLQL